MWNEKCEKCGAEGFHICSAELVELLKEDEGFRAILKKLEETNENDRSEAMTRQRINEGDIVRLRDGREAEVLEDDYIKRRVKVRYLKRSSVEPVITRVCEPEDIEEVIGDRKLEAYLSPGDTVTMKYGNTKVKVTAVIYPVHGPPRIFKGIPVAGVGSEGNPTEVSFSISDVAKVEYKEPKMAKPVNTYSNTILDPYNDTIPHLTLADLRRCMESGELVAWHPDVHHESYSITECGERIDIRHAMMEVIDIMDWAHGLFSVALRFTNIDHIDWSIAIREDGRIGLRGDHYFMYAKYIKTEQQQVPDFSVGDVVRVRDGSLVEVSAINEDKTHICGLKVKYNDEIEGGLEYWDVNRFAIFDIGKIELRKNNCMRHEFVNRLYNLVKQDYELRNVDKADNTIRHLTVDELKERVHSHEPVKFHPDYIKDDPKPCGFDPDDLATIMITHVGRTSDADTFDVAFDMSLKEDSPNPPCNPHMCVLSGDGRLADTGVPMFMVDEDENSPEQKLTAEDLALEGGRYAETLHGTTILTPHGTLKNQRIQERWGGEIYEVKRCRKGCPEGGCMCSREEE